MLIRINRTLRKILLIAAPIILIYKLIDNSSRLNQSKEEGFKTKEFDDIW